MPIIPSKTLPETSQWEPYIYLLNTTTDTLLGYLDTDPYADDIANKQAKQIANRTIYLKDFFEVEHYYDINNKGAHYLTNAGFIANASIEERKLLLDYGTTLLHTKIEDLRAKIALAKATAVSINNASLATAIALRKVIPYTDYYGFSYNVYELFNPNFTITGYALPKRISTPLALPHGISNSTVPNDDTIVVEDVTGITIGETYLVCGPNGENPEYFTVKNVLPAENRIIATSNLMFLRTDGFVSRTNAVIDSYDIAHVKTTTWQYMSKKLDLTYKHLGGTVYVGRKAPESGTVIPRLTYLLDGDTNKVEAALIETKVSSDGIITDSFSIPSGVLQIFAEYTGTATNYIVDHIVIIPETFESRLYDIRTPHTISAIENGIATNNQVYARDNNGNLQEVYTQIPGANGSQPILVPLIISIFTSYGTVTIKGSQYYTLYGYAYAGIEARIFDSPQAITSGVSKLEYTNVQEITVAVGSLFPANSSMYVQIRYYDEAGNISLWSNMVKVTRP